MRIYMDWEFYEDGKTISPISVGLTKENGAELYLINRELNFRALFEDDFLRTNVAPHLPVKPYADGGPWDEDHPDFVNVVTPTEIAQDVFYFISDTRDPELWADYAAYDHVCLAQLYGRMIMMPRQIPWQTDDIRTEWKRLGRPELPKQFPPDKHHALKDARHDRVLREFLDDFELAGEIGPRNVALR